MTHILAGARLRGGEGEERKGKEEIGERERAMRWGGDEIWGFRARRFTGELIFMSVGITDRHKYDSLVNYQSPSII